MSAYKADLDDWPVSLRLDFADKLAKHYFEYGITSSRYELWELHNRNVVERSMMNESSLLVNALDRWREVPAVYRFSVTPTNESQMLSVDYVIVEASSVDGYFNVDELHTAVADNTLSKKNHSRHVKIPIKFPLASLEVSSQQFTSQQDWQNYLAFNAGMSAQRYIGFIISNDRALREFPMLSESDVVTNLQVEFAHKRSDITRAFTWTTKDHLITVTIANEFGTDNKSDEMQDFVAEVDVFRQDDSRIVAASPLHSASLTDQFPADMPTNLYSMMQAEKTLDHCMSTYAQVWPANDALTQNEGFLGPIVISHQNFDVTMCNMAQTIYKEIEKSCICR